MSSDAEKQQQRLNEFMKLLPLTTVIAGLPLAEAGKYFNEGQFEVRVNALKQAFKYARQLMVEVRDGV